MEVREGECSAQAMDVAVSLPVVWYFKVHVATLVEI
jgi:hypothetical protein